jgi:large subunit ribosomal protein L24
MRIKKGDKVVVIAGKEKGKQGTVTKVSLKDKRVTIEGVNMVRKHVKPNQVNNEGKVITKEAPIHISNVALLDPKLKVPTKVGYKIEDGKKVRYAKKSSSVLK